MDMIEELAALKAQVGALAARVAAIENLATGYAQYLRQREPAQK